MNKLKIAVTSFNSNWVEKCLGSIEFQTDLRYDLCFVDDFSTDLAHTEKASSICLKNGWKFIKTEKNGGPLESRLIAVRNLECDDDDIIILIDGDDWLPSNDVFESIKKYHEKVWLTYGQFLYYPDNYPGICKPVCSDIIEKRDFRKFEWVFSHPKTFRYFLWKRIKDEDLRDKKGNYFRAATDRALIYPMLEMAWKRILFPNKILYVYNRMNPLCVKKINYLYQEECARIIQSKPKYDPLI